MKNVRDLFRHELKDIYDAEHRFRDALEKMATHVNNPTLKTAFEEHAEETEGQIERLDKVFRKLEAQPQRTECAGAKGIIEEHDRVMKEKPVPEVSNIFHVGAGMKAEQYEITTYETLVDLAKQLGLNEAAGLLEENLEEERRMVERLHGVQKTLSKAPQTR